MAFWVHAAASRHPDRVAIEGPERSLTYAELSSEAIACSNALAALTDRRRVALALASPEEFVVTLHGCLLSGKAAVPVDLRLSEEERDRGLAGADVVVTEPPRASSGGIPMTMMGDSEIDVAVMHTSGTTAAPKPIALTYDNFRASALGSAVALGLDPAER